MKYFLLTFLALFSLQSFASVSGSGRINYIVDGDTFDVQTDRKTINSMLNNNLVGHKYANTQNYVFRVRLANVDTAESVHEDESQNSQRGKNTSNYVKNMINGKNVKFECYEKGNYDRAICSIEVNGTDLGYTLIKEGYSPYITDWGDHPSNHWMYRKAQAEYIGGKAKEKFKDAEVGDKINSLKERFIN